MPAAVDWEYRRATDADVGAIVDLLQTCLQGGERRTAEFWRWKHQAGPHGPSPTLLATAKGRLIGVRAFLRWTWRSGPLEVPAVRAVDTATHPLWRGRGIFSHLTHRLATQMDQEGVAFIFNTPNRKSGPGYRKMGWRTVGRLPVYVKPLRLPGLSPPHRRRATATSTLRPVDELLDSEILPELLAAVERHRRTDPRLRTALTSAYLRWRYADVPGIRYRAVWTGRGDGAAALVVRQRRRLRLWEVSVSDLLVPPGAGVETAAELLRSLAWTTPAHYAAAVASPGTVERAALRRAGFVRLPRAGPVLAARPLDAEPVPVDPLDLHAWRFSTGALELF